MKENVKTISELLIRSSSTIVSSKLSIVNPSLGIRIASSFCSDYIDSYFHKKINYFKLEVPETKLRYWINVISLLYENTLKQSVLDEKIDDKEAVELEKFYNIYLDKEVK